MCGSSFAITPGESRGGSISTEQPQTRQRAQAASDRVLQRRRPTLIVGRPSSSSLFCRWVDCAVHQLINHSSTVIADQSRVPAVRSSGTATDLSTYNTRSWRQTHPTLSRRDILYSLPILHTIRWSSASVSSDLKALYKSVIIIINIIISFIHQRLT